MAQKKVAKVAEFVQQKGELTQFGLELLYRFMKKYNDAIIWIEQDWFYFYEDIIKIKQAPFDSLWCYKNPHS